VTDQEWLELLQSKEAHRLAISAGVGAATGGWGFLAMLGGFKLWDIAAKDARRHLDTLKSGTPTPTAKPQLSFRQRWDQFGKIGTKGGKQ
jgi:hypothetical protein